MKFVSLAGKEFPEKKHCQCKDCYEPVVKGTTYCIDHFNEFSKKYFNMTLDDIKKNCDISSLANALFEMYAIQKLKK